METELESLVVKLTGDGSDYQKMLTEASAATQAAAKNAEDAAEKIEKETDNVKGFAANAMSALAALGATNWLKEAFSGFSEAEAIAVKLDSVLQSNGRNVEETRARYEEFAKTMQAMTKEEDDHVINMLRQAETFDLTGKKAEDAVQAAISLAAVTDSSSDSLIRFTAALTKGNIEQAMAMARMIPQLRGVKDESEFVAKAQKLIESGMAAAQAEANTTAGVMERLDRDLGNLKEGFGEVVAEGIRPIIDWIVEAVAVMENWDKETKTLVVGIAAVTAAILGIGPAVAAISLVVGALFNPLVLGVAAAGAAIAVLVNQLGGLEATWTMVKEKALAAWEWIEPIRQALESFFSSVYDIASSWTQKIWDYVVGLWTSLVGETKTNWGEIRDQIVTAILAAQFIIENFGDVAAFTWSYVKMETVKFVNQIEYFFTVVLPATFDWFADNWRDIFTDLYNWTTTTVSNLVTNIVDIISNLPALLSGEMSFSDLWKPLTEGFERTSKELIIPERVKGELEKQLENEFDQRGDALGASFEEFRKGKLKEFEQARAADDDPFGHLFPDEEEDRAGDEGFKVGEHAGKKMAEGVKEGSNKFDAALAGSVEAISRVNDFLERQRMGPGSPGADAKAAGGSGGARIPTESRAQITTTTDARAAKEDKMVTLLQEIRDATRMVAERPELDISTAGLA